MIKWLYPKPFNIQIIDCFKTKEQIKKDLEQSAYWMRNVRKIQYANSVPYMAFHEPMISFLFSIINLIKE